MSNELETLLQQAEEQAETYAFTTLSVEEYCVIDDAGRIINLDSQATTLGVENDKAVERVFFRAPRYVGDNVGLDLSQCTVYINYMNAAGQKDQYIVEDLNISEENSSQVTFSWLLSRKVTQYQGEVNFIVCAKKVKTGGEIEQEWNTTLAKANVLEGLEPELYEIPEEDMDIVNQLLDQLKAGIEAGSAWLQDLHGVEVTDGTEPYGTKTEVWVDKSEDQETYYMPEIKDDETSETDTWSSQKINEQVSDLKSDLQHINILNIKDSVAGYVYKDYIGSDMTQVKNEIYTACNQVFNVIDGEIYTHNWLYAAMYVYDINRKLVLYDYAESIPHTLSIPENGKYMTVAGSTGRINNIMMVKDDVLPDEYVPYEILNIKTKQGNDLENRVNALEKYNSAKGVKWCAFGDSLTSEDTLKGMESGEKNYVDYVSESLGLDVTNCGVGGTGYMKTESNFVSRVQTIPSDTEILTVFGSFNDYEYIDSNLGEMGDSGTTTIYGCMKSFFDAVFTRCPDIIVGIILPTKWGYLSFQKDSSASAKCDLYVSALKDIAEYYSIPVLDLYNESNLRPWDDIFASKYYKDDDSNGTANTVHPLDPAHKKFIAPKVRAFICSLL